VAILPFLENQALEQMYDKGQAWDAPPNQKLLPMMPRFYACPNSLASVEHRASYEAETAYAYSSSWQTYDLSRERTYQVLGEEVSDASAIPWTDPTPNTMWTLMASGRTPAEIFGGNHPGGFHVLYVGGHVRFISVSADVEALKNAILGKGDSSSE
jgi:prepilin-type processing-associated H-X9-DG protein